MILTLCLCLSLGALIRAQNPTVTLPLGTIEGYTLKTITGQNYFAFKGVPYAKPPIGKHRFEKPSPPEPWIGTWIANTTYLCLQYNHFKPEDRGPIEGNEDCLYLNVYTPTLDPTAHLDVLVYIHGGAFMFKWGDHGGEIILDRNVVYVSINYRLGPLGFLSTEDAVLPGNNGLRDQNMALQWVRQYITYFGGNPNSVTISGTSAGGASTHWHYLMPSSKGLFHKGISQSGVTLNCWVLMESPLEQTKKLAELVGCPTGNSKDILKCLKKRPGRKITAAVKHFQPWLYNPYSPFGVVVDSWASDPVVPEHPYILLRDKKVHDVPYISAYTREEGLYPGGEFYNDDYLKDIDTKWNEIMPHILHYNFTIPKNQLNAISQEIRKKYLGNSKVTKDTFSKLIELLGDRLFVADIEKAVKLHAAAVSSQVYVYKFGYRGATSCSDLTSKTKENLGVAHADDTNYILTVEQIDTLSTPEDRKMSKIMVDIFTSFMKTGVPKVNNVSWEPVSKNLDGPINQLYIKDSENIVMESPQSIGNSQFWNSLPFKENDKLFTSKDEL